MTAAVDSTSESISAGLQTVAIERLRKSWNHPELDREKAAKTCRDQHLDYHETFFVRCPVILYQRP